MSPVVGLGDRLGVLRLDGHRVKGGHAAPEREREGDAGGLMKLGFNGMDFLRLSNGLVLIGGVVSLTTAGVEQHEDELALSR